MDVSGVKKSVIIWLNGCSSVINTSKQNCHYLETFLHKIICVDSFLICVNDKMMI